MYTDVGMPRPREFRPEDVLNQAMHQFWANGYRATSVDDLVNATGVKPGSLYGAFPGGKHDVLLGSLEHYVGLVIPEILGELEQPGASLAALRAFFDDRVRELLSDDGCRGCLIANSAIELAAQDDAVAVIVRAHYSRMVRCFETALRNARARGEISASIDPAVTAAVLFATCLGVMVIGKAKPAPEVLYAIVDTAFAGLHGPAESNP
jgi:TetR/AcrR family transcriptional regulator, transcriptional repressor for nem operon